MKKYIFMLIAAAAVMFGMMAVTQYIMITHGSQAGQLEEISRELEKSKHIADVKTQVEHAVWNVQKKAEKSLGNPNGFYTIVNEMVRKNDCIVGAGIAFRPGYFAKEGKTGLYAPYAFDSSSTEATKKRRSANPDIRTNLLSFDYIKSEWFMNPITDGKSFWTQPYLDRGGSKIIVCTFSNPLRDDQGKIAAIIFADVPMESVTMLSSPTSSSLPDDILLFSILSLACLLVFCFILWRAIVASINYKNNKTDDDRQYLIEEIEKLKSVNHRLTERNLELSNKIQNLLKTT